jgi:hypothetical protein
MPRESKKPPLIRVMLAAERGDSRALRRIPSGQIARATSLGLVDIAGLTAFGEQVLRALRADKEWSQRIREMTL